MSETQPVNTIQRIAQMFDDPGRLAKTSEMAPKNFDVRRMFAAVRALVARTPYLQQCSAESIVKCTVQAAEIGIAPTGALGGAYLVPYKNEATLIIGYRGMIDLARRSGQVATIEARVVYEKDVFDYGYGMNPHLDHAPAPEPRGNMTMVYAVATLSDGAKQFEVMSLAQVEAIRDKATARDEKKRGPWFTNFDEMARKTVVRRICKYLPLTAEAAAALDEEDSAFEDAREVEAVSREDLAPSTVEKLKDKLKTNQTEQRDREPGELTNEEQQVWEETEQKA